MNAPLHHQCQLMRLWYLSHRWPAHPLNLARAFTVCTDEVWKQTNGRTKNQTFSPTGWLCMHVWRMSLQRMKSTIISSPFIIFRDHSVSPIRGVSWNWDYIMPRCPENISHGDYIWVELPIFCHILAILLVWICIPHCQIALCKTASQSGQEDYGFYRFFYCWEGYRISNFLNCSDGYRLYRF